MYVNRPKLQNFWVQEYKIQRQLYPEIGQHSETTYSPIHNRNCNKLIIAQNEYISTYFATSNNIPRIWK